MRRAFSDRGLTVEKNWGRLWRGLGQRSFAAGFHQPTFSSARDRFLPFISISFLFVGKDLHPDCLLDTIAFHLKVTPSSRISAEKTDPRFSPPAKSDPFFPARAHVLQPARRWSLLLNRLLHRLVGAGLSVRAIRPARRVSRPDFERILRRQDAIPFLLRSNDIAAILIYPEDDQALCISDSLLGAV